MPKTLKHDPADRATCSYCRIEEDIHLLDGVLDRRGNDSGKLACIACYPTKNGSSWGPTGEEHIFLSLAPSLKPLYDAYLERERARRKAHFRLSAAQQAVEMMKEARDRLRLAGARNAADYAARALKSAEGAVRHAQRLVGEARRAQA